MSISPNPTRAKLTCNPSLKPKLNLTSKPMPKPNLSANPSSNPQEWDAWWADFGRWRTKDEALH